MDDLIKIRYKDLEQLKKSNLCPFMQNFKKKTSINQILSNFKEEKKVVTCGRIMAKREHGKSIFLDIKDSERKIQLYINLEKLGKENFNKVKYLDIGDIVGIKGELFKTRTNEPTIQVTEFIPLAKALRPLPEKWHGLKDIELRFRQRYLDLIMNQDVRDIFILRSKITDYIRRFLNSRGFLEVETPMMHPIPGGAAGTPFKTHLDVFDADLYLRIAPELYLKKLLVGDFEKIYEINRSFRNEGTSTRHNPEFTMLEAYLAYADYEDMMKLTQDLFVFLAKEIFTQSKINYQGQEIDLTPPWERISFAKVMKEMYDVNPSDSASVLKEKLKNKGISFQGEEVSRSQIINIVGELIEPAKGISNKPVFIVDFFTELSPLAKAKKDNPLLAERFELFIGGLEIANAYSELNDPIEQRRRFQQKIDSKIDEDFITALEYGMPPAGGLGIGIDRLLMLFADKPSIKEVILFPLLRVK